MRMWTKETSSKEKNHGVIIVRSHGIRMIHVGSYIESLRIGKKKNEGDGRAFQVSNEDQ